MFVSFARLSLVTLMRALGRWRLGAMVSRRGAACPQLFGSFFLDPEAANAAYYAAVGVRDSLSPDETERTPHEPSALHNNRFSALERREKNVAACR